MIPYPSTTGWFRFRQGILLLLVLSLGPWGLAQPTGPISYTLEEAIAYALENNIQVKNARFDEYIAAAQVKEVVATGLPQVSGSGELQYFIELPTTILPPEFNPGSNEALEAKFGFPWQSTFGLSVSQLVFDGTFFLGVQAAKTFKELSAKSAAQTREETALAVSQAYVQALIAQEQADLIQANLDRVRRLYEETKALNEAGFAEEIDVDRLQINLNNLELEQQRISRYIVLSKDMLKFQMGMSIEQDIALSEQVEDLAAKPTETQALQEVDPSQRIEYSLLRTQQEIENYNLRRIRAGYYPSLYAFGNYQFNAQRNEFNFFDSNESWFPISVVGLNLSVPIFDGLRKHRQMEQSRLELKKIENQFEQLENSISLEVKSANNDLLNAYNNLESLTKNRELAQKVYRTARIKYKEGVGSSLELNEAENDLKQAESNYLSGLYEYLSARLELQKAKGEFARYHRR
jgi:outer membrane protein